MYEKKRTWPAIAAAFAGLVALAGCGTTGPGVEPSLEPASAPAPGASAAPSADTGPAKTLRPGLLDAPAATSVEDAQRSAEMAAAMTGDGHGGHGGHGSGTYRHVDVGRGPGAVQGSEPQHDHRDHHDHHDHGAHGAEEPSAAVYTCPMHPEVTSSEPGECPKCGMALVERRKE